MLDLHRLSTSRSSFECLLRPPPSIWHAAVDKGMDKVRGREGNREREGYRCACGRKGRADGLLEVLLVLERGKTQRGVRVTSDYNRPSWPYLS